MVISIALLALPAAAWVTVAAVLLLVSRAWRMSLAALVLQYTGVFVLTALSWPVEMAAAKMVAGWMAALALAVSIKPPGKSRPGQGEHIPQAGLAAERFWPASYAFRLLAVVLVGLVVASAAPGMRSWIPGVRLEQAWSALGLIGLGLLQLGLTAQPLRVTLGLLTILSGFEVAYAAVERSVLVAGLLAMINLILALVGAYLIGAAQEAGE